MPSKKQPWRPPALLLNMPSENFPARITGIGSSIVRCARRPWPDESLLWESWLFPIPLLSISAVRDILRPLHPSQLKYLYPFASLIKNGVPTAAGSDAPIAPVNPLAGIYGAVTRRAKEGGIVLEKEKIGVYDAVMPCIPEWPPEVHLTNIKKA